MPSKRATSSGDVVPPVLRVHPAEDLARRRPRESAAGSITCGAQSGQSRVYALAAHLHQPVRAQHQPAAVRAGISTVSNGTPPTPIGAPPGICSSSAAARRGRPAPAGCGRRWPASGALDRVVDRVDAGGEVVRAEPWARLSRWRSSWAGGRSSAARVWRRSELAHRRRPPGGRGPSHRRRSAPPGRRGAGSRRTSRRRPRLPVPRHVVVGDADPGDPRRAGSASSSAGGWRRPGLQAVQPGVVQVDRAAGGDLGRGGGVARVEGAAARAAQEADPAEHRAARGERCDVSGNGRAAGRRARARPDRRRCRGPARDRRRVPGPGRPSRGTASWRAASAVRPRAARCPSLPQGRTWWASAIRRTSTVSAGPCRPWAARCRRRAGPRRARWRRPAKRGTVTEHSSRAVVCRSRVEPTTEPVSRSSDNCSSSALPGSGLREPGSAPAAASGPADEGGAAGCGGAAAGCGGGVGDEAAGGRERDGGEGGRAWTVATWVVVPLRVSGDPWLCGTAGGGARTGVGGCGRAWAGAGQQLPACGAVGAGGGGDLGVILRGDGQPRHCPPPPAAGCPSGAICRTMRSRRPRADPGQHGAEPGGQCMALRWVGQRGRARRRPRCPAAGVPPRCTAAAGRPARSAGCRCAAVSACAAMASRLRPPGSAMR